MTNHELNEKFIKFEKERKKIMSTNNVAPLARL